MRRLLLLPCLAWLTGCAASGGPVATCTNLISTGGGLLQFCQRADKLQVSESGVDPAGGAASVQVVNDPSVLHALERDLRPRPDFAPSRRLVARACLVNGQGYVSVAASDLRRIMGEAADSARSESPADLH